MLSAILLFITLLVGLYLVALHPNTQRARMFRPFERQYIAHRGFFDNDEDHPENSLAAFALAVKHGYGIELDVRMTADQKLVVFHDDNLFRMCNVTHNIEQCTFEELQQYHLANSSEKIPLFTDVLAIIAGKVPIIVEIKDTARWRETTEETAKILDEYKGHYCIESFNPFIITWYKKNRPEVVRGILSTNFFKDKPPLGFFKKLFLTNLLFNFIATPDFIAYNHKHKDQFSYKLLRRLYRVKNVAWTIKSQQELKDAKSVFTCFIFDSFVPDKK